MKQQWFNRTKFLTVVLILMLVFLLLLGFTSIFPIHFNGLISDFRPIDPETTLDGTKFLLEYVNQNVILKNRYTDVTLSVVHGYSPVAQPPSYNLLRQPDGRVYVTVQLASGGNSGAFWFKIFEITTPPARDVEAGSYYSDIGLSCTYPRVDGNVLIFRRSANCADSPATYQEHRIPLT